jgi:hypothetical protein
MIINTSCTFCDPFAYLSSLNWNLGNWKNILIFEIVILDLVERVSVILLQLIQFAFTHFVLFEFTNEYTAIGERDLCMSML